MSSTRNVVARRPGRSGGTGRRAGQPDCRPRDVAALRLRGPKGGDHPIGEAPPRAARYASAIAGQTVGRSIMFACTERSVGVM